VPSYQPAQCTVRPLLLLSLSRVVVRHLRISSHSGHTTKELQARGKHFQLDMRMAILRHLDVGYAFQCRPEGLRWSIHRWSFSSSGDSFHQLYITLFGDPTTSVEYLSW